MSTEIVLATIGLATEIVKIVPSILEFIKSQKDLDEKGLRDFIDSKIEMEDVTITSEKLIQILADKGLISIIGGRIHSDVEIKYSSKEGEINLKDHVSTTPNTKFFVSDEGEAKFSGNSEMVQNSEGVTITTRGDGSFFMSSKS